MLKNIFHHFLAENNWILNWLIMYSKSFAKWALLLLSTRIDPKKRALLSSRGFAGLKCRNEQKNRELFANSAVSIFFLFQSPARVPL